MIGFDSSSVSWLALECGADRSSSALGWQVIKLRLQVLKTVLACIEVRSNFLMNDQGLDSWKMHESSAVVRRSELHQDVVASFAYDWSGEVGIGGSV